MSRNECRMPGCDKSPGEQDREDYRSARFCSVQCDVKYEHLKDDARDAAREEPTRCEPADFGYGESTGVQTL